MSEEEIIRNVKRIIEYKVISNYINDNDSRAIQGLLDLYNKEKEKNKKAKEFIKENSHEFNCKRDDLIELEFDDNTNATDLIDILDGNW